MLTRLDDRLSDHDKLEAAAEKLGRYGYERALGAVCWGIQYANNHGTDGFLPAHKVARRIHLQTAQALVEVNLWEPIEGGYCVHDFLDWNPSAAAVKTRMRKDRERKRKAAGYSVESEQNGNGIHAEGERSSSYTGQDRTGQVGDREFRKEPERTAPLVRGMRGDIAVPWRVHFYGRQLEQWALRFGGADGEARVLALVNGYIDKFPPDQPIAGNLHPFKWWDAVAEAEGWFPQAPTTSKTGQRRAANDAAERAVIASLRAEDRA